MESLTQHKYARLAQSAYYYNDRKHMHSEILRWSPALKDFQIDEELSSEDTLVFVNKQTREIVVSFRGTTTMEDVKTDLEIIKGTHTQTAKYQDAVEIVAKVQTKYADWPQSSRIVLTGHSLGGGVAIHVAKQYPGLNAYVYNPAISFEDVFEEGNTYAPYLSTVHVYHTPLDPVSRYQAALINAGVGPRRRAVNFQIHTVPNGKGRNPHSVDGNFYVNTSTVLQWDHSTEYMDLQPHKETILETTQRAWDEAMKRNPKRLVQMVSGDTLLTKSLSTLSAVDLVNDFIQLGKHMHAYSKQMASQGMDERAFGEELNKRLVNVGIERDDSMFLLSYFRGHLDDYAGLNLEDTPLGDGHISDDRVGRPRHFDRAILWLVGTDRMKQRAKAVEASRGLAWMDKYNQTQAKPRAPVYVQVFGDDYITASRDAPAAGPARRNAPAAGPVTQTTNTPPLPSNIDAILNRHFDSGRL